MTSNYPSHGPECNARTFPITCKYCKMQVFYFSCDHGSQVFFEELGAPWKRHQCVERSIAILGPERIKQEIANRMMMPKMTSGYEHKVKKAIEERRRNPKVIGPEIQKQDPYMGLKAEEWGIIRELILNINIFKKLNVEDTPLWRRSLDKLVSEAQVQITIHTGALGDNENSSFTFFVKQKVIKQKALTIGDFIKCNLRGISIPGHQPVWICDRLKSAYD